MPLIALWCLSSTDTLTGRLLKDRHLLHESIFHFKQSIRHIKNPRVVGDHQDTATLLAGKTTQQLDHFTPGASIKGCRRFIGK